MNNLSERKARIAAQRKTRDKLFVKIMMLSCYRAGDLDSLLVVLVSFTS